MAYSTMGSAKDINLLFSVLKFTAIILFPKYNSGILLLYNVFSKRHRCFKQRRLMLQLKPVPEDLLRNVLTVNDTFVIGNLNSCMVVNSKTLKTLGVSNLCWSKILIKSGNDHSCLHILQVLTLPEIEDKVGIITSALHYNLKQGFVMIGRTILAEKVEVLQSFIPHIATSAKVGLLQNIDVDNSLLNMALSNYFEYPRFLRIGEAFGLDMFVYAPFHYRDFLYCRLFVKVTDIEGPHYKSKFHQDVNCGYYVQKECSSLIQCENQNIYAPSTDTIFIKSTYNEKEDNFKYQTLNNIPAGLEAYRDELMACILPFIAATNNTSQLKPLFLLSGPLGVGKECIVKNVSETLGLNIKDFDSFELQGGSPGYAEGRLKCVFLKVQQCAPCILVIKNAEVLCKDKNGNEDDRAANAFIDEIQILFREIILPVIVVVICNSKDGNTVITPMLTRMFLHSIHVEIPDDSKRLAMLQWLLKKHGMRAHADISCIVSQTSGYLYADLIVLLSLVIRSMYKHMRKNGKHNCKDVTLTKIDFEKSLDAMQATYSVAIDAPKIPKVTWDDIGGLMNLKKEITRTVMLPLQHSELLATGLRRSGILLYGPPGTGKTLLAKAIATECNLNFLSVKGPELLNMYVGQSEENVREVFERARAASPCIIFFDELDSLAPNRGKSGDSGGVMDRVVSQMLAELDGQQKSKLLFVIGATNRPDLIDPALLRPGRFEKLLHVGVCEDRNSQLNVMQTLTKRFKLRNDVDLKDIANSLPNKLTGADIYSVCSQAWLIAVHNHIHNSVSTELSASSAIEVGMMDFGEAVKYLMPSVSEDELVYYRKMNKQM